MSTSPPAPRPFAVISDGRYLLSNGEPSHFTVAELACRCGCGLMDMDQRTIDVIEAVRMFLGMPVFPNCGIRCEAHNRAVGGKPLSQHLPRTPAGIIIAGVGRGGAGRAIDFSVKTWAPAKLYQSIDRHALELGVVGLGKYPGFVHVDTRIGGPARWEG